VTASQALASTAASRSSACVVVTEHRLKRQRRFSAKAENRGVVVTEAGSYSRLIDSCITQLKAQGPFRTCNESKDEEEEVSTQSALAFDLHALFHHSPLGSRAFWDLYPRGALVFKVRGFLCHSTLGSRAL